MYKPFYETTSLLLTHKTIDTSTLGDPNPSFKREAKIVKAHLGVNATDILDEIQEIEDEIERMDSIAPQNRILTTTLTEYEDLVTALNYLGFIAVAQNTYKHLGLKRERYAALAQELIDYRDKKQYG